MRVKVLPKIETTGLKKDDVTDLAKRCREKMLDTYNQISEEHKEEYVNMKALPAEAKNK